MACATPEDLIFWDEAVAEGRIPENVRILRDQIFTAFEKAEKSPLHEMTLPNGQVVESLSVQALGPYFGVHISQEDLNKMWPKMNEREEKIQEHYEEHYADMPPPTTMRFEEGDLHLTLAYRTEREGTRVALYERDGARQTFFLSESPFLNGTHILHARIMKNPQEGDSLSIELTEIGRDALARATRENIRGEIAIIFQGEVISILTVWMEIDTPGMLVTGLTDEQMQKIVSLGKEQFREKLR